jgi:hypothetical protein
MHETNRLTCQRNHRLGVPRSRGRLLGASSMYNDSPLTTIQIRQGPFARPALPGVITTMAPSESRLGRLTVMVSRPPLANQHTLPMGHHVGSPKFMIALSTPAVPNHPGPPSDCMHLLLHRRFQASPSLEGWPRPICVTRPNRVHLRYG